MTTAQNIIRKPAFIATLNLLLLTLCALIASAIERRSIIQLINTGGEVQMFQVLQWQNIDNWIPDLFRRKQIILRADSGQDFDCKTTRWRLRRIYGLDCLVLNGDGFDNGNVVELITGVRPRVLLLEGANVSYDVIARKSGDESISVLVFSRCASVGWNEHKTIDRVGSTEVMVKNSR